MRTLIIGGCGFLGCHAARALERASQEVRILDLRPSPTLPLDESVEIRTGDFGNVTDLQEAMQGIDTVVHFGSLFWIQDSMRNPIRDAEVNVVGSLKILDQCVKSGVKRVLFASSGGTIYGPVDAVPISENHPTNPISTYGVVKRTIEMYLSVYQHAHGLEYAALRISNPYGPGQQPKRGQGVIAALLYCARTGEPFPLYASLKTVRDYVHVSDVAEALVKATGHAGLLADVLNIGSGEGVSLEQLIGGIEEVTGRKIEIQSQPNRTYDVTKNVLDATKAKSVLGWSPKVPLQEGIADTWDWIQKL